MPRQYVSSPSAVRAFEYIWANGLKADSSLSAKPAGETRLKHIKVKLAGRQADSWKEAGIAESEIADMFLLVECCKLSLA